MPTPDPREVDRKLIKLVNEPTRPLLIDVGDSVMSRLRAMADRLHDEDVDSPSAANMTESDLQILVDVCMRRGLDTYEAEAGLIADQYTGELEPRALHEDYPALTELLRTTRKLGNDLAVESELSRLLATDRPAERRPRDDSPRPAGHRPTTAPGDSFPGAE